MTLPSAAAACRKSLAYRPQPDKLRPREIVLPSLGSPEDFHSVETQITRSNDPVSRNKKYNAFAILQMTTR